MKKMYTRNEISKLMHISYKALRGYEQKGLIKPSYVDKNGYKYYSEDQIFLIDMIRYCNCNLDIPLLDIQKLLGVNTSKKQLKKHLLKKKDEAKMMIEKYEKITNNINRSLSYLDDHDQLYMPYISDEICYYCYLTARSDSFLDSKESVMQLCEMINDNTVSIVVKKEEDHDRIGFLLIVVVII